MSEKSRYTSSDTPTTKNIIFPVDSSSFNNPLISLLYSKAYKCINYGNKSIIHLTPYSYCRICKLIFCQSCINNHILNKNNHNKKSIIHLEKIEITLNKNIIELKKLKETIKEQYNNQKICLETQKNKVLNIKHIINSILSEKEMEFNEKIRIINENNDKNAFEIDNKIIEYQSKINNVEECIDNFISEDKKKDEHFFDQDIYDLQNKIKKVLNETIKKNNDFISFNEKYFKESLNDIYLNKIIENNINKENEYLKRKTNRDKNEKLPSPRKEINNISKNEIQNKIDHSIKNNINETINNFDINKINNKQNNNDEEKEINTEKNSNILKLFLNHLSNLKKCNSTVNLFNTTPPLYKAFPLDSFIASQNYLNKNTTTPNFFGNRSFPTRPNNFLMPLNSNFNINMNDNNFSIPNNNFISNYLENKHNYNFMKIQKNESNKKENNIEDEVDIIDNPKKKSLKSKNEKQKFLYTLYKINNLNENGKQNNISNSNNNNTDVIKILRYSIIEDKVSLLDIIFNSPNRKDNFPKRYYKTLNTPNSLYLIGGEDYFGDSLNSVWKFDLNYSKMKANKVENMIFRRKNHNVIYLKKYKFLFVCGGDDEISCEYYNLNEKNWKSISKILHSPIKQGCLFLINETKLFLLGGYNTKEKEYNQRCEMLDLKEEFENFYKNKNEKFWKNINIKPNCDFFMKSYMGIINLPLTNKVTILGGEKLYNIDFFYDEKKIKEKLNTLTFNENIINVINLNGYEDFSEKNGEILVDRHEIKGMEMISSLLFEDCQSFIDLNSDDNKNEHFKAAFTNNNKLLKFNCNKHCFSFKYLKINN